MSRPFHINRSIEKPWSRSEIPFAQKIAAVAQEQDNKAGRDAAAVTVAALIFFPAALLLAAGEDQADELANLKGELDALTTTVAEKGCISEEQLAAEWAEAEALVEARQADTKTNFSR